MDVVGSTYPSFEHPAAPDRNVVSLANIVDFSAFEVATDATGFDIDDPGCVRLKGVAGVLDGTDAFIQTDRCREPLLECRILETPLMRLFW